MSQPPRRVTVRQGGELLAGRLPDNVRFRLPRRRPDTMRIAIRGVKRYRSPLHPSLILVYGFLALIAIGTVLLSLPVSSASGHWTHPLDALFTATSAVCVAGLVVLDTGTYWSGVGQLVLLLLMQLGGLGFMTNSTLLLLLAGRRISLRERMVLRESLGGGLGTATELALKITVFAIGVELAGAIILALRFSGEVGWGSAIWIGAFHSVSAFTNGGFDIIGGFRSLTPYNHDAVVLLTHAVLIALGGVSYLLFEDVIRARRFQRLTLDSKLVIVTTLSLIVVGTLGFILTEGRNPATLASMDAAPAVLNAFFFAAGARTAGFNAVDIAAMTAGGQLLLMGLMFIGGAAGSMAGGIKVQTFSLLLFAIVSALRAKDEVEAFHRRVPTADVLRALSVSLLAIAMIFIGVFALSLSDSFAFNRQLFEAVSAFATAGLSTGMTAETSPEGRVILILMMFIGRLGPLTLALALMVRQGPTRYSWPQESVRIG